MPSMATYISRHNAKILKNGEKSKPPSCNCQKSKVGECPIPGACNTDGVVYQATVKNNIGKEENYIQWNDCSEDNSGGHSHGFNNAF